MATQAANGDHSKRKIVQLSQDHSFKAERVPLSESADGSYTGNFTMPFLAAISASKRKRGAAGFTQLYAWLGRDCSRPRPG